MSRVLIGLGSLVLVAVWGGVALVHAASSTVPDFVVEGTITGPSASAGMFTLTNNTTQFSVKAFAVSRDPFIFVSADTNVRGWTAEATNTSPIPGLPGTGGGSNPQTREYAVYTACDVIGDCGQLLGQGTAECFDSEGQEVPCFTFILSQTSLPPLILRDYRCGQYHRPGGDVPRHDRTGGM